MLEVQPIFTTLEFPDHELLSKSHRVQFFPFALVALAFTAELWRAVAPRFRAALRACLERALCDAADRPSVLRAALVARERVAEGLRR